MKIEKVDHIALAVKDVEKTTRMYEALLSVKAGDAVLVPDQGVNTAYIPLPGTGIEILQPTDPNSGIQKFIDKKGEGIHHIAVKVADLETSIAELTASNVSLIIGTADGKKAVFIHPRSTGGVLIELCE